MKLATKHLLTIRELSTDEVLSLVARALELKQGWPKGLRPRPLTDKAVAMIFEKSSTRTRVSFEIGVSQLGGHPLFMASRDMQLARSEPLRDTARILSRYADAMVVRTFGQEVVEELATHGSVPVINALTDKYHPCQVMSDLLTVNENMGDVRKPVYAWVGDGNNMAHSWLEAAARLGFELRLACPEGYLPDPEILGHAQTSGAKILLTGDPAEAVEKADVISTDVWTSMGQEEETKKRLKAFSGYCLNQKLLERAKAEAIVMHCLPAHRGEEISEEVLEGPNSVVWDQAENRLHMQKAIMEALMTD
jgi:ornithine carbamoyltransferase